MVIDFFFTLALGKIIFPVFVMYICVCVVFSSRQHLIRCGVFFKDVVCVEKLLAKSGKHCGPTLQYVFPQI